MRFRVDMPLARAFVLSAGMAVSPLIAYAQSNDNVPEPDTHTLSLHEDETVESLLRSAGLSDEEISSSMAVMYQNLFRISRNYIRPVEMEELEQAVLEGVRERLNSRVEKLEQAQDGVDEAGRHLESLQQERSTLVAQGSDVPATLRDTIIEAEIDMRRARLALRQAENFQIVTANGLINAGLNHAFGGLDPHTAFGVHDPGVEQIVLEEDAVVNPSGIGAVIMPDGESRYVLDVGVRVKSILHPQDNTPARRHGLKPGDLITHIDGEPLAGLLLKDAQNMLSGAVGSRVSLQVQHAAGRERTITMNRAHIQPRNVTYRLVDGDVGYIHIDAFMDDQVSEQVSAAIKAMQQEAGGAERVSGYVISVRDNGGGLLDEVVELNNLFIDGEEFDRGYGTQTPEEVLRRNSIVTTSGREGFESRFLSTTGDIIEGKPLAVLINGGSASASEIFAGAIQEYRGTIVGIRSFGKGTVQIMSSGPGGVGRLKHTISEYTFGPGNADTPLGLSIQGEGVVPNVLTPFVPEMGKTEAGLANTIPSQGRRSSYSDPQFVCDKKQGGLQEENNVQDDSLVDPRSGEYDYALHCAVLTIKGAMDAPQNHNDAVLSFTPFENTP